MWWTATAVAATWPSLGDAPAGEGGGGDEAALVVGVDDYLAAPDVPGAADNATDWYSWLTQTRGVPADRVRLLRNAEASREAILEGAAQARADVAGGTLWVVFVGHGAPAPDGRDGLLVGVDAQQTAKSLLARSVSRRELLDAVAGGEQDHTVVVLDACFSGRTAGGELVPGLQPMVPTYVLEPRGAVVLSAGASDQFAGPLPGLGRPAFSYLVLGGLWGWADADGDGVVRASEATDYARSTLKAVLNDRDQVPELQGDDVVLARGGEAGPPIASIVRDLPTTPPVPPPPSPAPDAALSMRRGIWRLRNTAGGQTELEDDYLVHAGVGLQGIVVGRTRMAEVRGLRSMPLSSPCTVEGRELPKRRGERSWPCRELPERHWSKVTDLQTDAMLVHVREVGEPVDFIETEVRATARGIEIGMPLQEALALMPTPPDDTSGPSVQWYDLGLQLLIAEDRVRLIRVWPADGEAP